MLAPVEIAYFTMEIALESSMPTYAGGLGVLAGDSIRAAADLGLPMAAVSLVHRQGYFRQTLDAEGNQRESPDPWRPEEHLEEQSPRVTVRIEDRQVQVRAWCHRLRGPAGAVPVYLLDTDLPDNAPDDRRLTDALYGGDQRYRLAQEMVLGLGGVAMLEALGQRSIRVFHMNEGHSALVPLALLEREPSLPAVRERCVFTTHTPVPAGHEKFPLELARALLGDERIDRLTSVGLCDGDLLDMTRLALGASRHANAVSRRHAQISRELFPGHDIDAITNGVHAATWAAPAMQELFTRHIPDWRAHHEHLRYASVIQPHEIAAAHLQAKRDLLDAVARQTGTRLGEDRMLVGFARRATRYKRAHLLLSDAERLRQIAERGGPLHILYAGKAHPRDAGGHDEIRNVFARAGALRDRLSIVYLEGYDMDWGRRLCAGCDLWVNTPEPPQEACGTSGMKAAVNGVPQLGTLDGWWLEGHVEGVTGWSVDAQGSDLHDKLEQIVALYHREPEAWQRIMRHTISLNGSFFETQRMMRHYAATVYCTRARMASNNPAMSRTA